MKYYYVYRITNKNLNKHYYGKRSSKLPPKEDLGYVYFSSSKDKTFKQDQKDNPKNYKYKILKVCNSSEEAVELEIKLHNKFNVGVNRSFYNRCKQTSTGFDTTGVKYSEERIEKCRKNFLGKKHTKEAKEKCRIAKLGNTWNKGRKHSEESINKMKEKAKRGKTSPNAVLVNIFDYKTDELVASSVVLSEWCKEDKSLRSNLAATLRCDRTKASSRYNQHQSKGFYAKYS